jgi:hypothetical protein
MKTLVSEVSGARNREGVTIRRKTEEEKNISLQLMTQLMR